MSSKSIDVNNLEKLPRKEIRAYFNDLEKNSNDDNFETSSPISSYFDVSEDYINQENVKNYSPSASESSQFEKIHSECIYPSSEWLFKNKFHIAISFLSSTIQVNCQTAVDAIVFMSYGIKSISIIGINTNGIDHKLDTDLDTKKEFQKIQVSFPWPIKQFQIIIKDKHVNFPCIYKVFGLSSMRSSRLSTPIKAIRNDGSSEAEGKDLEEPKPSYVNSKQGNSFYIARPQSATNRVSKAHLHGSAATLRISSNSLFVKENDI